MIDFTPVPHQVDKVVVACNLAVATKEFAEGALCYVTLMNRGNDSENIHIRGRSRGGRWITKWERAWKLKNFRYKTLPPEHPRYGDRIVKSEVPQWHVDQMNAVSDAARTRREGAE